MVEKNESGHGTERQESCSEEEGQSDAVRKREREREKVMCRCREDEKGLEM